MRITLPVKTFAGILLVILLASVGSIGSLLILERGYEVHKQLIRDQEDWGSLGTLTKDLPKALALMDYYRAQTIMEVRLDAIDVGMEQIMPPRPPDVSQPLKDEAPADDKTYADKFEQKADTITRDLGKLWSLLRTEDQRTAFAVIESDFARFRLYFSGIMPGEENQTDSETVSETLPETPMGTDGAAAEAGDPSTEADTVPAETAADEDEQVQGTASVPQLAADSIIDAGTEAGTDAAMETARKLNLAEWDYEKARQEVLHAHPLVDKMKVDLEALCQLADDTLLAAIEAGDADVKQFKTQGKRLVTILPLAALVVSLLLSLLITRNITGPIRELRAATRRIADGDFSKRVRVRHNDEVGDLAQDMNRMSTRLDELDEMKSSFLFSVSHELKTPLTSIKEAADLLEEEVPGELNDKQRRLIKIVGGENRKLISMISGLLDLARMEAGKMGYSFESADLNALIEQSVSEIQFIAESRKVQLRCELDAVIHQVMVDEEKLMMVLTNLLDNAIKFSPPESEITVTTALTPVLTAATNPHPGIKSLAPQVAVSVRDQGAGIPEKDIPLIFDKFYQSERRAESKVKGTGLGLAIARHVVEAHGGTISVKSAEGSGSTFTFTLPLQEKNGRA